MNKTEIVIGGALALGFVNASAFDYGYNYNDPAAVQYYKPDAYGLGVNSDSYGRPFKWETNPGQPIAPIFQDDVRPNCYGYGVGCDPFGRPVRPGYK